MRTDNPVAVVVVAAAVVAYEAVVAVARTAVHTAAGRRDPFEGIARCLVAVVVVAVAVAVVAVVVAAAAQNLIDLR